jgi:DNA-binding NtrC family response regulator
VLHHASHAAAHVRRQPERIVLDELLASIEKEAIVRALAQAGGNKTQAAELLGMTRPRLYRRLVQLGLAGPEFIETEPTDYEAQ